MQAFNIILADQGRRRERLCPLWWRFRGYSLSTPSLLKWNFIFLYLKTIRMILVKTRVLQLALKACRKSCARFKKIPKFYSRCFVIFKALYPLKIILYNSKVFFSIFYPRKKWTVRLDSRSPDSVLHLKSPPSTKSVLFFLRVSVVIKALLLAIVGLVYTWR